MKTVKVQDAVGMVIAHDMTEIIPGVSKKAAFRKGQIIREEDVERLLKMGKEHIAILELTLEEIHENDAAIRMAEAAAGQGLTLTSPSEGKVSMTAAWDGLLKVDTEGLLEINCIEDIMMATLHNNRLVEKGMVIGGTRIIPLVTDKKKIVTMEAICREHGHILQVLPLRKRSVGIITTGSEVYHGRIKDKFAPVVMDKVTELGCDVVGQKFVSDDPKMIVEAVHELIDAGADMIACTGGMSVDPDDVTPLGIRMTGAEVVAYGAPVLPGAMFMLAYLDGIPIVGLPGCVMYAKRTIFDLVLPRILADEILTKKDIVALGHGGLCTRCDVCTFPNCGFGKSGR